MDGVSPRACYRGGGTQRVRPWPAPHGGAGPRAAGAHRRRAALARVGQYHRHRSLRGVPRPRLRRGHGGGGRDPRAPCLRAAAADPAAPLRSVADIPDAHGSERSAVGMLREAKVYAEGAYDTVGWSLDRLLAAYNLLDHPGLPGVDGLLDAERAAAHGYLVVAENLAGVSAAYAYTALCFLFPELDLEF
ncbi:unnamed protein product [Urochloa humidicola]